MRTVGSNRLVYNFEGGNSITLTTYDNGHKVRSVNVITDNGASVIGDINTGCFVILRLRDINNLSLLRRGNTFDLFDDNMKSATFLKVLQNSSLSDKPESAILDMKTRDSTGAYSSIKIHVTTTGYYGANPDGTINRKDWMSPELVDYHKTCTKLYIGGCHRVLFNHKALAEKMKNSQSVDGMIIIDDIYKYDLENKRHPIFREPLTGQELVEAEGLVYGDPTKGTFLVALNFQGATNLSLVKGQSEQCDLSSYTVNSKDFLKMFQKSQLGKIGKIFPVCIKYKDPYNDKNSVDKKIYLTNNGFYDSNSDGTINQNRLIDPRQVDYMKARTNEYVGGYHDFKFRYDDLVKKIVSSKNADGDVIIPNIYDYHLNGCKILNIKNSGLTQESSQQPKGAWVNQFVNGVFTRKFVPDKDSLPLNNGRNNANRKNQNEIEFTNLETIDTEAPKISFTQTRKVQNRNKIPDQTAPQKKSSGICTIL